MFDATLLNIVLFLPLLGAGLLLVSPAAHDDFTRRLTLVLMTLGSAGMYVVPVVLPAVQADFGVARADASLPYTFTMVGFGLGGILMGKLSDRFGVMVPVLIGAVSLGAGFVAAAHAEGIWQFSLVLGLLIGMLGTAAGFAPLVADTSLWFVKRRGVAVPRRVGSQRRWIRAVGIKTVGLGARRRGSLLGGVRRSGRLAIALRRVTKAHRARDL